MRQQRLVLLKVSLILLLSALSAACAHQAKRSLKSGNDAQDLENQAPRAARKAHIVESANGNRQDDWYWLRDDTRKDPEVLAYLEAENAWYKKYLAPQQALVETLNNEILSRIKQDDASVPYQYRGYWYYTRFEPGREYAIHARRKGSMHAPEQILLDGNVLATGQDFMQIAASEVSDDGKMLAYMIDTRGHRQFELRVRDLRTGKDLPDVIGGLSGDVVWAADNKTVFYAENDPQTLLASRVRKHVIGADPSTDALVYEEADKSFYLGIDRTGDGRYITILLESTTATETRYISANTPNASFKVFTPRLRDHLYDVDHVDSRWIIRSNWNAKSFRLMQLRDGREGDRKRWTEILAHRDDVTIEGFAPFRGFIAISERSAGLKRVRLRDWRGGNERYIEADDDAYVADISINREQRTDWLRYSYSSLTTPNTIYDVNIKTGERKLLKREEVLGGFATSNYVTERIYAPSRDGVTIPVTLLYRKDFERNGSAPLLQYAYGSYGMSIDPYFDAARLSLVDRGVVYAIAHIRGGQELGRAWYEAGKLQHKKNSFTDFIDVTHHLVAEGYAAKGKVAARGGSAGGLLMGAVANIAPHDYRAIVAQVPFVDVVTTMLDETIPLTTNEFDEWGNPKEKAAYDYMLSYSPYDNVSAQAYPAMFVSTRLWDPQVAYFEPAKWVAKLREMKTDTNPLLFKTNMSAGHGGKSGRFQRYRETAEVYTFVLDQLGIAH